MNVNLENQLRNARPALDVAIERAQRELRTDDRVVPMRRRPQLFAIAAVIAALAVVGGTIAFVASRSGNRHQTKIAVGGSATTATVPPDPNAFSIRLVQQQFPTTSCPRGTVPSMKRAEGCFQLGPALLDLSDVVTASASVDPLNGWGVDVTFTSKRWPSVVRENVGQRLAIVVDGRVASAPVIEPGITGPNARISGAFTEATAKRVAAQLSAHR